MKRIQFEPLTLLQMEEEDFHAPMHGQNYYELVYIIHGRGVHIVNQNRVPYEAGNLFVVSPEDQHYFEIVERTCFTFILFTDDYFREKKMFQPDAFLLESPIEIMRHKPLKEVAVPLDRVSADVVRKTIEQLMLFHQHSDVVRSGWVYYQILSIFGLIKSNIGFISSLRNGEPRLEDVVFYINQYIYTPELIRRSKIAAIFGLSDNYFSTYFKKNFGVSYQAYTNQYKLKLIEKRLVNPRNTIKQIAEEFGFFDESHLSHFFKRMNGLPPSYYRADEEPA